MVGDLAGHRAFLQMLFRAAVAAAHPSTCLPPLLPQLPQRRLILLAAGKAAGSMAETAEGFYLDRLKLPPDRLAGLAVARHGYGRPTRVIEMIEAGHPIPDAAGLKAAEQALKLAESAGGDDLVLARHAYPARLATIAISDVPYDDPSAIGSGPTVPDPTTLADARAIVAKYRLDVPDSVARALDEPNNESPKPGDKIFANTSFALAARPADSMRAAEAAVRVAGYACVSLGDQVEGEARDVAVSQAKLARELRAQGKRAVILSGGELTVTMRGQGRGGPNQEFALALAIGLAGMKGVAALSADTDGTDGGTGDPNDPAGALVDGDTVARAKALGLDPAAFLADNNSTGFFGPLKDLLITGPTYTNVNDFRAIVVDRP
jgi:glycerate 2-kinase